MKKNENIRVGIVRMEGDVAPFVQVEYMDRNAQEHSGLMLLDSGSTINILAPEMANDIGTLNNMDEHVIVLSIAKGEVNARQANFSFVFGGTQFRETFCISDNPLPIKINGMRVLGLLGNNFLSKHRLAIDYCDYTLHTSNVSPDNLSISDCSFFFPMEMGLKFYGLPVLSVKQNGKELVTLVDTGATNNMIAGQSLTENAFKHKLLEDKDVIVNVTGEVEVNEARVWFNVMSLDGDDICEISHRARFKVLPYNIWTQSEVSCDEKENQLPPIEILLGSPFIANEGWTLDFGAGIIYKKKVA